MAKDDTLSHHEKVGFPDEYREGKEEAIFSDICGKLGTLNSFGKTVLEVGPGCSRLPRMLSELCAHRHHRLLLVDSAEMLALLPNEPHTEKWAGRYPDIPGLLEKYIGQVGVVIAYSVIQYVFAEGNLWDFIDRSLSLLEDGGEMLLGDVPNTTMRKRFFASNTGIEAHRKFTVSAEVPEVKFNCLEPGQIDDSVVLSVLGRARAQGFHAWVVPQGHLLPMANRREDIVIRKP
jgi:hypothetical protein